MNTKKIKNKLVINHYKTLIQQFLKLS